MMRQLGLDTINVTCTTDEVLIELKKNREEHLKLYAEAKEGYLKKAADQLKNNLEKIEAGEFVSVNVHLSVPECHVSVYDTAIKMMEMSVKKEIELTSSQFRQMIMNEWDWLGSWVNSNAGYSAGIMQMSVGASR